MKALYTLLVSLLLLSTQLLSQGATPGCYCVAGELRSVLPGEFLSIVEAGIQYSAIPCQAAFGQADGSICSACICTDQENDAGLFQVQNRSLFTGTSTTAYILNTCESILGTQESLLFCGLCPFNQLGLGCEEFVMPDPIVNEDDTTTIPTMGDWGVLILSITMLIFSIVVLRERNTAAQIKM